MQFHTVLSEIDTVCLSFWQFVKRTQLPFFFLELWHKVIRCLLNNDNKISENCMQSRSVLCHVFYQLFYPEAEF
jgi:hypothetical protein